MTINGAETQETSEPVADSRAVKSVEDDSASDVSDRRATDDAKAHPRRSRSISISVGGAIGAVVVAALVAAVATLGWLYLDVRHQVDAQATESANAARAEKIALDYAVNAATMDFKDLPAWHVKLVAGTSPELNKKLSDAGTSMEQVLVPLEWSSTAQPLVAKVRSTTAGVYVVDSFVSVQTKTVQAPEALQSTATYSLTIDSNQNWLITDVGGIGSAMGPK